MANTISVMLRTMVSKKRRRYTEGGYDLDLAYICPNIIAMGYPGENVQGIFRNHINDVCGFFEATHKEHYKVYNLRSDMTYDANKFHGRVSVYAFEDHNPPTIELIQKFCYDVDCWLKADSQNVAAIHCKAGKGRTGTMICCYLLYSGLETTAEKALAYYGEKRTINQKGVTIPSQRRYVQYYARLIQSNVTYERIRLQLCEIRFSPTTTLQREGTMQCLISTMEQIDHRTQHPDSKSSKVSYIDSARPSWTKVTVKELNKFPIDFRKTRTLELYEQNVFVTGDVKIELKKFFHFWFNTFFVCDNAVYEGEGDNLKMICTLPKCELDDAHKDKDHKVFPEDFEVQLVLKPCNLHTRNIDSTEIPQLRSQNNHNNHVNSLTLNSHNNANMLLTQKPMHVSALPTSSKTGDYSLYQNFDRSRKPTSMPAFSPPNQTGVVAGGSSHTSLNHMQNLMQRHHQQQQQQQQQQQKRSSEPTPSVNPESITRSNNKNHNSNHHHQSQQQLQQQQQQQQHTHQHTHHHNHHHHLHHEQQKSKPPPQLQSQQNNKTSTSSNNIHNTSSNSNSSSSSSISSQSSSSASSAGVGGGSGGNDGGVGEEEDWESGESSTTTTTTTSTTFTTTTTTTSPTTTSYFPYKRLNSSQNDDDDDNSNKNVKHDDDDDDKRDEVSVIHTETTKSSTVVVASTTNKSESLITASSMVTTHPTLSLPSSPPSINVHVQETIPITRLPFALPLSTPTPPPTASSNGVHVQVHHPPPPYITPASIKHRHMHFFHKKCTEPRSTECTTQKSTIPTKCTAASNKFLKLIKRQRFKAKTISSGMGSSLALNSGVGASSSAATQNQLLKKKKKVKSKGKIPPAKTFQWLHSYFRTDPDFHENLSQQTTIPMGRRNSAGSVSSRNHLNSIGSTSGRACSMEKSLLVGSLGSRGAANSMDLLKFDDDDEEDEYHFLGLHNPDQSSGAVKKNTVLMPYHIKIPAKKSTFDVCHHSVEDTISPFVRSGFTSFNKCKSDLALSFGSSPRDRALGNIVDIGIQLNPESEKYKYPSMSELNAAALLMKNNLRPASLDNSNCDDKSRNVAVTLPRSPSPPSNERTTSIGSSNISNSMDHLSVPYSNMYLQPQLSLDDSGGSAGTEVYQDPDDYYSSICDNQLSFNNSPCKSPRSLSEVIDLKPAITQRILLRQADCTSPSAKLINNNRAAAAAAAIVNSRKNTASSDGIVIAKPVESHSIGFNVEFTNSSTPSPPSQTTEKYNNNSSDTTNSTSSPIDSNLKLITNAMSDVRIHPNDDNDVLGDGNGDDVCVEDRTPLPKATVDGSSSSSSGYCCTTSDGSQSVSSTSIGITDTISSSGTAFSLDGGSSGVDLIGSTTKKKLSLPTPEIEVCEIGMTKNRSSSVSNNDNHNNISKLLASSSLSSSSSSGSSVDNNGKH